MALDLRRLFVPTWLRPRRQPGAPAELPVRTITVGRSGDIVALHVSGDLATPRLPILCLPGYTRNMADYAALLPLLRQALPPGWPIVLADLRGRGRSSHRKQPGDYTTVADAVDVSEICRALGLERIVAIGQGHGAQVAMALRLERPTLLAGAVLIDAGPVTPAESLIRLRGNMEAIASSRGRGLPAMLRQMLKATYPALEPERLDRLATHTHRIAGNRARALFDDALIERLKPLSYDDSLAAQWSFFDLLRDTPILLVRSSLTDQLSPDVLAQMSRRRPEAQIVTIEGQGSPPLLDREEDARMIGTFVRTIPG